MVTLVHTNGVARCIAYTASSEETPKARSQERAPAQQPKQPRPPIIVMNRNKTNGRTKMRCY